MLCDSIVRCVIVYDYVLFCWFFFFKQKTAYEIRISDWSSDVCSSDLRIPRSSRDSTANGKTGRRMSARHITTNPPRADGRKKWAVARKGEIGRAHAESSH